MPQGYLVQLGNNTLNDGDRIVGPAVFFDSSSTIGPGDWSWSGQFNGDFDADQTDSGVYFLGTDNNVYFVPDDGLIDNISSASAVSPPSHTGPTETLGTPDDDISILGDAVANTIRALDGDDSVTALGGDDTVEGGAGNDTLEGGDGNDVIYGDWEHTPTSVQEVVTWSTAGTDEENVTGGLTVNTGSMDVSVTFVDNGALEYAEIESTDDIYAGGAEGPFDTNSSLVMRGSGGADVVTATIDFDAAAGSEFSDEVQNVSFRINDIDSSGWTDVITVNAVDASGASVTVTITPGDIANTVVDNTVTAGIANTDEGSADGSVLFEIEGPVKSIEIIYENDGTSGQRVWLSDIHFETIVPEAGDDSIDGGDGDDYIEGNGGDDFIEGGTGNDEIHGDWQQTEPVSESINWLSHGNDNQNIEGGMNFTTGDTVVTVNITDNGALNEISLEDDVTTYVGPGEPFDSNSAVEMRGDGGPEVLTADIIFSAAAGAATDGTVQNVQFRINDIDSNESSDTITVNAYDADGNLVAVTITTGSPLQLVVGNTITSNLPSVDAIDSEGSVLFEIEGPVARIEIIYENSLDDNQRVFLSDIHYDTVLPEGGDDTLDGGLGADTLYGGAGNDAFIVGANDEAYGGDGDDVFILTDTQGSGGTIFIQGGEGEETTGDVLQLNGLASVADVILDGTPDGGGGLSGTVTLSNGTEVTFENIESIICFTPGTMIETPHGPRAIETLQYGDMVLTRDAGPQPIRWIGGRTVPAIGKFAPIEIAPTVLTGTTAPLLVSPQHQMLFEGYKAELLFGDSEVLVPAAHLVNGVDVIRREGGLVTYIHLMFDTHHVITANGAPTESFFVADAGLAAISDPAREELFSVFPELRTNVGAFGPFARRSLRKHEALLLED